VTNNLPPNTPPEPVGYASPGLPAIPSSQDDRSMAMLAHLLGIFTGFLGPLIIWLMKKDQSPFVDDQAKESLNFQIFAVICFFGCFVTFCFPPLVMVLAMGVQIGRIRSVDRRHRQRQQGNRVPLSSQPPPHQVESLARRRLNDLRIASCRGGAADVHPRLLQGTTGSFWLPSPHAAANFSSEVQ